MDCKKIILIILALSLNNLSLFAFQNSEDGKSTDYRSLSIEFYTHLDRKDTIRATRIAKTYLELAKKNEDSAQIPLGYYFFSKVSATKNLIKYSDSVIAFTKHKPNGTFPIYAYHTKAGRYFLIGDYKKAFDGFLKVEEEAKKYNNSRLYFESKQRMGILKLQIGEYQTALSVLQECYKHFSQTKDTKPQAYLNSLYALSEAYTFTRKIDSATYLNKLGLVQSTILDNEYKKFFTYKEGINQYHRENYNAAKDSLKKAIDSIHHYTDYTNKVLAHFYLGKTFLALKEKNKAIEQFKKADESIRKGSNILPEFRKNYEILIAHYKKTGNKDEQLKYIKRLLKADSIINDNYKYLIKNVVQNYDTPRLLAEKQEIIHSLEREKKSSFWIINTLLLITGISLLFWIVNWKKRKNYKKRFDELLQSIDQKNNKSVITTTNAEKEELGISDDIIATILTALDSFEQNEEYLQPDITTNSLAKSFKTNSKYLSKVVNAYKKKTFSTYINDLRIDYSIQKLRHDSKFKNYTMHAIAREIGFNTPQAFSKSFFKKNGIHPSYFIKQLEKQ